eukprot:2757922-Pyramimonas_sp.AAC.1
MKSLWHKGRAYRSPAITFTLITKGHCLDPIQISTAQPLQVVRRLFTSPAAPRLLSRAKACWELMKSRSTSATD